MLPRQTGGSSPHTYFKDFRPSIKELGSLVKRESGKAPPVEHLEPRATDLAMGPARPNTSPLWLPLGWFWLLLLDRLSVLVSHLLSVEFTKREGDMFVRIVGGFR